MDVIDEKIYKCLDELDLAIVKDLAIVGEWKEEEESEERKNSINCLTCIHNLIDTNDNLRKNSILLIILKKIFQKHKNLFENLDYDLQDLACNDDLPFSLKKYWKQVYPQLSRILIDNLVRNDLDDLSSQFRFSETLEFFLLIERSNFWQFYEQIRKERLIVLSREQVDLKVLTKHLIRTLEYEIYLICNYRYIQNLGIEYSDFILIYSNIIKATFINRLESIKNNSTGSKVSILLNAINELNEIDEFIKSKSKLWSKLDLPNSVNQKRLQWDYKDYFVKKDYFNFLLNELNKELNLVTNDENDYSIVSINNTKLISSFVNIIKILDRYNLIYIKQLKKAFTVLIEVNINQFIQIKFTKFRKRKKDIYLHLNTLYYVKDNFGSYGVDSNKVNELISDLECEFKAKHLFVLNSNVNHMEYYVCYLNTIQFNLLSQVNYNLYQSQKLYQDLLQESFVQLEDRSLENQDLIFLLSNLPDLVMFSYDNEGLFIDYESPFKKVLNKFAWKLLFKITLLNAPLEQLSDKLSKVDGFDAFNNEPDDLFNSIWIEYFNPSLYVNLPYYHALVSNRKSLKHFAFICRPFLEFEFKFTIDLLNQLVKDESSSLKIVDKAYRKNRNRLLRSIFNLVTTSVTQLSSLSSIILPLIQDQNLNFDCIQFELLIDDSLYLKHSTKLNQLDWIWGLVKLVKNKISTEFEIVLSSFLYKYTDLIRLNELDVSALSLFTKLNLKFLISENHLLDELIESIFKLACDSLFIIPNGLLYSLELITKTLKSNDQLIFGSLTIHIILFAICKQLKSMLKSALDKDSFKILYSKIISNLLSWLTFPEDHDLNNYRNKFNDLLLRRKMNLNVDYIQMCEVQELESLFRLIEINYDSYCKDVDLLESFLSSNSNYLNAKLKNREFNEDLILNNLTIGEANETKITNLYAKSRSNYDQSLQTLKSSFNYDQLLKLVKGKTNKTFIRNNLEIRNDFNQDHHQVNNLKKIFQIS